MKKVCFVFVLLLVGSVASAPDAYGSSDALRGPADYGSFGFRRFRRAADPFRRDPRRGRDRRTTRTDASLRDRHLRRRACGYGRRRSDRFPPCKAAALPLSERFGLHPCLGASDVDCAGLFESGDVRIELGGASDLGGLELAAAGVVSVEAGGSSDIDASVRCRELNGTFSGASDIVLSGFSGNLYCDLSGASDMKVSGAAGIVSVKCSGASDFDAAGLVTAKLPCRGVGCFADCAGTRRERTVGRQRRRIVDHLPGKSVVGLGRSFFHLVGAPGTLIIL